MSEGCSEGGGMIPTFRKHWSASSAHLLGPEAQSANGPLTGCRKESKIDSEKQKDGKMQAREKKERNEKWRNSNILQRMECDNITILKDIRLYH